MEFKLLKKKFFIFAFSLVFSSFVIFGSNASELSESPKIERHLVFDTIPLNLEEIIEASSLIFSGVCTNVENIESDEKSNLPVYKYTFKVIDNIKGANKEFITFKQWQATSEEAGYSIGEKYILFLYPESKLGLTSPVGFLQGQFAVQTKGFLFKKEVVKNKISNKGLSRNLRTQKNVEITDDTYLNTYLHECSENAAPMRYKEFVTIVKHLVNKKS